MGNREGMQICLDYIEQNLKTELTAEEISGMAGFSVFHFYRLFQSAVGMPVMQYITRRRLLWAAWEIAGGKKIVDTALLYGFDTSAGFYKAFVREFHCPPSEYARRFRVRKPYRINLLQEEHVMLTNKKLKAILENWGMEHADVRSVRYENTGEVNENVFEVGREHYLKICTNLATVRKNIAIAKALAETGIASALPVLTKAGTDYVEDGELYFILTIRIQGESLKLADMFGSDYREKARSLGEMLGQLHRILQKNDDIVCNERNIFEEVRDMWLEPSKKAMQLSDEFCKEYLDAVERWNGKLPEQIIHRDPNPSNIVILDGVLAGFLDFDLSQRSIRLFDPCYTATALLMEIFDSGEYEKLDRWVEVWQNILRGYDAVIHMTPEEKAAVPYVVLSIQLICVGYFSGIEKLEPLAKTNIQMTQWLIAHRDELRYE